MSDVSKAPAKTTKSKSPVNWPVWIASALCNPRPERVFMRFQQPPLKRGGHRH
jgi:hypothetical protein